MCIIKTFYCLFFLISRYSPINLPEYPKCNHCTKSYRCSTLKNDDVLMFHKAFYSKCNKIHQDNFIIKFTNIQKPKRVRNTKGGPSRKYSTTYWVQTKENKRVPVCKRTFTKILCIGGERVKGVLNRHFQTAQMATERRGGDKKKNKFLHIRQKVIEFIKKFKPLESHYCRAKIACRIYLASDLNIRKMWKLFQRENTGAENIKESYFRFIFNTSFNIGFGSPSTDVCSKCLELREKIKNEKDASIKTVLTTEYRIHKLRAKAFFEQLKEKRDGLLTISFDCQKNLVLPKIPDQSTYYSRQLYIYNFTTVVGHSHAPLTKDNVKIFTWTEDEHAKGANEIASCVFYTLNNSNLEGIDTLRLVADGCGGQNKNTIMICMLFKWLSSISSSIRTIELVFPVVGHSYIPPDRVFATIEKEIRKKEEIVMPEEYINIFQEHATVFKLGKDVPDSDWKGAGQKILKPVSQWHFKFNQCKRYIIRRGNKNAITIRGELSYRSDTGTFKGVFRKNQTAMNIQPKEIPTGVKPKDLKMRDVNNLLSKHYGKNWREVENLAYYRDVLGKFQNNNIPGDSREDSGDEEPSLCESTENIPDVRV